MSDRGESELNPTDDTENAIADGESLTPASEFAALLSFIYRHRKWLFFCTLDASAGLFSSFVANDGGVELFCAPFQRSYTV